MSRLFLVFILVVVFFLGNFTLNQNNFLGISKKGIEFADFPKTRKVESGLLDGFNLDSKSVRELVSKGKTEIGNNLYMLTQVQILDQDMIAYGMEIKDIKNNEKSFMSKNSYPFISGLVVLNKRVNKAFQLYYPSVWFSVLAGDLAPVYLKDINLDGSKEFVVEAYRGGNSMSATNYYIFQVKDSGFKLLNPDLSANPKLSIYDIYDSDFDGKWELIVIDDTWEISRCTDHAQGPISYSLYSWKDSFGYVDDSLNYQRYYQNIIDDDISDDCSGKKEFCFGPALHKYFAYKNAGKEPEGWAKFLELTKGVTNMSWPSKTCLDYVVNLHEQNKEIVPPRW